MDRQREQKHERDRDGQNMHEGVLIRVVDTPSNGMTHPSSLSLSSFIPFVFEVLGSLLYFFIQFFFYSLGHTSGSTDLFLSNERELRREERMI